MSQQQLADPARASLKQVLNNQLHFLRRHQAEEAAQARAEATALIAQIKEVEALDGAPSKRRRLAEQYEVDYADHEGDKAVQWGDHQHDDWGDEQAEEPSWEGDHDEGSWDDQGEGSWDDQGEGSWDQDEQDSGADDDDDDDTEVAWMAGDFLYVLGAQDSTELELALDTVWEADCASIHDAEWELSERRKTGQVRLSQHDKGICLRLLREAYRWEYGHWTEAQDWC